MAPSWTRIEHRAGADATLFTLSDEPLMRLCNYYRFEADLRRKSDRGTTSEPMNQDIRFSPADGVRLMR